MKKRTIRVHTTIGILVAILPLASLYAGGQAEAGGGSQRGSYLAEQGYIIPANEVFVDSYIASIDYEYPVPDGPIGVYPHIGNSRLSRAGGENIIHIGVQGTETAFEDLPPMNLAFVIDISGSMAAENKLDWVKEAFGLFIAKVRPQDFVALVVFDDKVETIFSSSPMDTAATRRRFSSAVSSLRPRGGTNLTIGLERGYQEVMANFRSEYTNRVLFLTDGQGNSQNMLEMAAGFREIGVNVSTIGVGTGFDTALMVELATQGGGSSRFIANRQEMEEIFSTELDRMLVPAARNISLDLRLAPGVELLATWGYRHEIMETDDGTVVRYSLPTLHNRDYETILARIKTAAHQGQSAVPGSSAGEQTLQTIGIVSGHYSDLAGNEHELEGQTITAEFVDEDRLTDGYSDPLVLKSGTVLDFARTLVEIGNLYYGTESAGADSGSFEPADPEVALEIPSTRPAQLLEDLANRTRTARNRLYNVQERLGEAAFATEIGILDNYLQSISSQLPWSSEEIVEFGGSRDIPIDRPARSTVDHLNALFGELGSKLTQVDIASGQTSIALADFHYQTAIQYNREFYAVLGRLIRDSGTHGMTGVPGSSFLAASEIESYLSGGQISAQDLMDTTRASLVGRELGADLLVTGSVVELGTSFVVFARLISVRSGEVLCSSQVLVEKQTFLDDVLGT